MSPRQPQDGVLAVLRGADGCRLTWITRRIAVITLTSGHGPIFISGVGGLVRSGRRLQRMEALFGGPESPLTGGD